MSAQDRERQSAPPLVSFDPAGRAPLLSYNVPEPTAYAGRSYVELDIDQDWFRPEAKEGTTYEEWLSEYVLDPDGDHPAPAGDIDDAAEEAFQKDIENVNDGSVGAQEVGEGGDAAGLTEFVNDAVAAAARREQLTHAVVTMFQGGDSGPIIGATDRRLQESVAAVANATERVDGATSGDGSATSGDGSTALADDEPESDVALHSTVRATLEPNLFATEVLSEAGSGTAPMASAMLAQSGAANDVDLSVLRSMQPSTMAREMLDGRVPVAHYTMGGRPKVSYTVAPPMIRPQLLLVERYRLSTFLGNYGAGRTVKTFSLLPGERTTISVKTFRKSAEERQASSSILDSYTTETAEEFEESVTAEQSNKEAHEQSFAYHAEAKAEAKWGWGSASVEGGVKGSTNAAREESAKNISTATSKHAAEASAKRDVQIDTNYEVTEETGEETSIERQLENINLSRTLNYVFRQMNQEFVTVLHLVDVRVAFTNGGFAVRSGTGSLAGIEYREVSLPELDDLLGDVIVEDERDRVRELIEGELSTIFDFRGESRSVIEHVELPGSDGSAGEYTRVVPDLRSTYSDETGTDITVPGIILSADKNVMRTDGIVVEALLGGGEALDDYAQDLQGEEVRKRLLENDERRMAVDRERLAQSLVTDGDDGAVDRFDRIFTTTERANGDSDEAIEPQPEKSQPNKSQPNPGQEPA
jgi:hypothetical protein